MYFLRSTLIERDTKLQQLVDNETKLLLKQSELERDLKLLEQKNCELKSSEQTLVEQLQQTNIEQIYLDLKHSTHERDLAIVEKKTIRKSN
jgi:negative regulator of sigma E activity